MPIDLSDLSAREALSAIYIGYYDRAADPAGLAFWEDVVDADGFNLTSITTLFASASETQALFPFFTDPSVTAAGAFVTQLYQNLFNRDPDMDGLAFWTEQLQNSVDGVEGAATVGQIITNIIEGAQAPDDAIILNKIEVALDWTDSANAAGTDFDLDGDSGTSARSIIDDVDESEASVIIAKNTTDDFFADGGGGSPVVAGDTIFLSTGGDDGTRDNLTGTEGNDTFEAYNGELQDGDRIDGGSGRDTLDIFQANGGAAKSPITSSVETVVFTNQTNDLFSESDNNVGNYSGNFDVDVELDAGQMNGVTRWENFDSRADLVIEDARDQDDTDGTFTGDITVAMVSTDPGNVDYAVYFDQPVNVSQNFGTLELRVLDQEAAFGLGQPNASSTGYLTESSLTEFTFAFDGQEITVTLADEEGVTYGENVSFQDLLDQVENATQAALIDAGVTNDLGFTATLGAPVSVGVGNQFTLPLVLTFDVTADTISASNDDIIVVGRDSGNNGATPSTDTFGSLSTARTTQEELIRLNVDLDDVGKGSMGGDALFGAMSTGRQVRDDRTSDSLGIQQFDIEVDRSSQLQTINSTNNSLEVVNINNGENDGPNNTTTASDEMEGDLVVRGQANPANNSNGFGNVATDNALPGAAPQHNVFGFSDVREIDASGMIGSVDLTAELTEETVEKYLNIQDQQSNGNNDDVTFDYDLGTNDDEFLLNMNDDVINEVGTGSREDFNLEVNGNDGGDVITTNIGDAFKTIDEQGQDYYLLTSDNSDDWYENSQFSGAASFRVDGDAGDDVIWTHGWGDFNIFDGSGNDVVYTDNSGVVQLSNTVLPVIDRNLVEHEQIDYVTGAVFIFNGEDDGGDITGDQSDDNGNNNDNPYTSQLSGRTNDNVLIATGSTTTDFNGGTATIGVSFEGLSAIAGEAYTSFGNVTLAGRDYNSDSDSAGFGSVNIREQKLNQAIKEAINDDAVMSQVLEAVDGPGNSLIIYSKIDGSVIDSDTLNISVNDVTVNNVSLTENTNLGGTDYANDAEGFDLLGGDSDAESDNIITVAGDNDSDVFVLSTNDGIGTGDGGTVLNGASNETLVFNENFGVDTVFNFDASDDDATGDNDDGEDVLDFSAITDGTNFLRAFTSAGQDVVIDTVANVDSGDNGSSIEAEEVVAYAGGGDNVASNHILIVHDTNGQNGGQVWFIEDGAGASDMTATNVGTINLIGTDWDDVSSENIA